MPGRLIARGRTSVVHDLGGGRVLRRRLDPSVDATREAAVMAHARRHGVPVPAVHHASGPDLVMELIQGPSMLDDLVAHPDRAAQHGHVLVDLHRALDAVPPMPGHRSADRLLHLDLHPGNVLLPDAGPVLVDWSNAAHGARTVDVATTWLVVACMAPPEPWPGLDAARQDLLDAFLASIDRSAATRALTRAARTRLADPGTSQREAASIDDLLAQHAS